VNCQNSVGLLQSGAQCV